MEHGDQPSLRNLLHITNWYPNPSNRFEALFVQEHFKALADREMQQLWHVQVRGEGSLFRLRKGSYSSSEHYFILDTCFSSWQVREWLHFALLALLRLRLWRHRWDVVNVHIAYPLLRFPRLVRWLYGQNIIVTEHWSAYHEGFKLPENSPGRRRIRKIFQHRIPVIAVSQALMDDIVAFAETDDFAKHVIPNVVNPDIFSPGPAPRPAPGATFVMAGSWSPIKRPLLVMQSFAVVSRSHPEARLRIIGYGSQWEEMRRFARESDLQERIAFLGPLGKAAIATELRKAAALVHASEYETFSVVCAEALCCGTPVIASRVGGIPEYVDDRNGITVENDVEAFTAAMEGVLRCDRYWNRDMIAFTAAGRFNPATVGAQLATALEACAQATPA